MTFTGEMLGTVHRVLLETHQSELRPGSVLLLKQVGSSRDPSLSLLGRLLSLYCQPEKLGPGLLELRAVLWPLSHSALDG